MSNEIIHSCSDFILIDAQDTAFNPHKHIWDSLQPDNDHLSLLMRRILQQESHEVVLISSHVTSEVDKKPRKNRANLKGFFSMIPLFYTSEGESKLIDEELQFLKQKHRAIVVNNQPVILELEEKEGFPWDEIKGLNVPIFMEQLTDLVLICENRFKENSSEALQQVFPFILSMIKIVSCEEQSKLSEQLQQDVEGVIGQLVFLVDRRPEALMTVMKLSTGSDIIKKMQQLFTEEMLEVYEDIKQLYDAHESTQLQSAEVAYRVYLPQQIAKTILTSIGSINIGLIDTLLETFLSHKNSPLNYEINISYALKLLKFSPKFREEFKKIHPPKSRCMPSNDVIRSTLNLNDTSEINEIHAKQSLLSALLSHLRQDSHDSCFATALAIEILSSHLTFCLQDLRQLLEESKLTRKINDISISIPFLKRIGDDNLDKEIDIDSKGLVVLKKGQGVHLSNSPGIRTVCQLIGIQDPIDAINRVVKKLFSNKSSSVISISIKDLIKEICKVAQDASNKSSLGLMLSKAYFAFSSQTSQPLLKIWENAIAGMAESREGGMIKSETLNAVSHAIQVKFNRMNLKISPKIEEYLMNIHGALLQRISFKYDPTIGKMDSAPQVMNEGGFVLYNADCRVDSAQGFQRLMVDLLEDLQKDDAKKYSEIYSELTAFINTDDFLKELLLKFHKSNQTVKNLSGNYRQLKFTPWITRTGNNSQRVLEVYLESTDTIVKNSLLTESPLDLLVKVIENGKALPTEEKESYAENVNKLLPMRIPRLHTFSLMLGHPSLSRAWASKTQTQKWIQKYVIGPGKIIAETTMNPEIEKSFIKLFEDEILHRFLPKITIEEFNQFREKIPKKLTIKKYRQAIIDICQKMDSSQRSKFYRQIDTALCQSLPLEIKNELIQTAVHFADTNWSSGSNDIHLCFIVNPGTGELEVWEVFDDNSHLIALDQNKWLLNKEWEFFSLKGNLTPDEFNKNSYNINK